MGVLCYYIDRVVSMKISYHGEGDWCHLCGQKKVPQVNIWSPDPATFASWNKLQGVPYDTEFTRICINCINKMKDVLEKKGRVKHLIDDAPSTGAWNSIRAHHRRMDVINARIDAAEMLGFGISEYEDRHHLRFVVDRFKNGRW